MEKLNIIDNEYEDWVPIENFNLDAEIANRVQMIYCDTRDFAIGWNFDKPKFYKKAECNYEIWQNEGLRELYKIFKNKNKKYIINKKDILKWLDELCKKVGGYEFSWRYLSANLENCKNWNLKYIRFVRNDNNRDEFIVCNNYLFPISYKEIIDNINMEYLCIQ